jgi:FkbM family methyltransferase
MIKGILRIVSAIDGGKSRTKLFNLSIKLKSFKPRETFSQFGEDAVLSFFLHEKNGGYLDVGAGHFRNGNNSYSFYKRGWTGICVEPIPKLYDLLKQKRPHDSVIQKVISRTPKKINFYEFDPYEYSTSDPEVVVKLEQAGIFPIDKFEVDSISINDLGLKIQPTEPYFLTVDCEGRDVEIVKSINFQQFCPRVICCEVYPVDAGGRHELESFLKDKNYRLMSICVFSLIFVHEEYLRAQGWSRYI